MHRIYLGLGKLKGETRMIVVLERAAVQIPGADCKYDSRRKI
jgi:hypothetical protein